MRVAVVAVVWVVVGVQGAWEGAVDGEVDGAWGEEPLEFNALSGPLQDLVQNMSLIDEGLNATVDVSLLIPKVDPIADVVAARARTVHNTTWVEGEQVGLAYSLDDGTSHPTPLHVEVHSTAVENGWWTDDYSCCGWWDLNRIGNPEITWDGGPPETRSYVVMMDDMDDGAAIEWLMINIDPREHRVRRSASGECPWYKLIWPWWYGRCYRQRLPGSGFELPNRNWRWRFRGICPPDHQTHRYRIRVFAQDEWDQRYLRLRWPHYNADDVARQLVSVGHNVGVGSLIANGGRKEACRGAPRDPPSDPPEGLVAHFDFTRKTLQSLTKETPPIEDIGAKCNDKRMRGRFVGMDVRGEWKTVYQFVSGTGLAFNASGLLPTGDNTEYTIVVDVRMDSTWCYRRLLNINAPHDYGLYFCWNLFLYPDSRAGPYLHPGHWYHIAFSTRKDRLTRIYINGRLYREWYPKWGAWRHGVMRPAVSKEQGAVNNHMVVFFNDCGDVCRCAGGRGEQSGGYVHQLRIFEKMLSHDDIELMYMLDTTRRGG